MDADNAIANPLEQLQLKNGCRRSFLVETSYLAMKAISASL